MKLRLPEAMYEPRAMAGPSRVGQGLLAAALLLLSAWQLFDLPGAPVRRVEQPLDLPWFGFGLQGGFIEPDGTWIINREGYADRQKRYVIHPDGELEKQRGSGIFEGEDVSGSYRGVGVLMAERSALRLRAGAGYYRWQEQLRRQALEQQEPGRRGGDAGRATGQGVPAFFTPEGLPPAEFGPMNVIVKITQAQKELDFPILNDRSYFGVYDSACFIDPDLWLTSGHLRQIHRVLASDAGGRIRVRELASVELNIENVPDYDSLLLHDPRRGQLALLLSDGRRFWFDPATLELAGQDRLPGYWKREYASYGSRLGRYGLRTGFGLSEAGYQRLLRALMLVFLASLLWLAWLWRGPWKYTLAATTGDSGSSNRSAII